MKLSVLRDKKHLRINFEWILALQTAVEIRKNGFRKE